MPKYLVTGNAGSGKSAVIEELKKRGYAAFNTDDLPDVTRLEDLSGQPADPPRPVDWSKYGWNWQEKGLKQILNSQPTVFVAAIVSNQQKFYPLFDRIFVLTIDKKTLKHRLTTRTSNDYGKHPDELKEILQGHSAFQGRLASGTSSKILVDGTQPLPKVVNEILSHVSQ